MKAMVIGSGREELELCRALRELPHMSELYCAPGGPDFRGLAWCLDIEADDPGNAVAWAKAAGVELTLIVPQSSLDAGMREAMEGAGIATWLPRSGQSLADAARAVYQG